jgi:hypothetical protein
MCCLAFQIQPHLVHKRERESLQAFIYAIHRVAQQSTLKHCITMYYKSSLMQTGGLITDKGKDGTVDQLAQTAACTALSAFAIFWLHSAVASLPSFRASSCGFSVYGVVTAPSASCRRRWNWPRDPPTWRSLTN